MKYYSDNYYSKEEFVKYYEKKGNEIIVTNGKNKTYKMENNEKNIVFLNRRIQNQIWNNDITKENVKSSKNKLIVFASILLSALLAGIIVSSFQIDVTIISRIIGYTMGFCIGKVSCESIKFIYLTKRLNDKYKQLLFLNNKELLNNQNSNALTLGKISKKSEQELYTYLENNNEPFNIKTVHKLKYKELKSILENLKQQQINNENFLENDIIDNDNKLVKRK